MQCNTNKRLSAWGLALVAGLALCNGARAEPDVLERAAAMRTIERSTTSVLLSIARAGERFVTVGERGLVLWSDDQGKSWQQATVPVSVTLTSVEFADPKTGWAVGHSGVILRSDDAGKTWVKVLDGKQAAALVAQAAKAPGADPQFAASAERLVMDGPDKPFLDVQFFDQNRGLVVGAYGLALETSDGGKQWHPRQQNMDNPKGLHLYGIMQKGKTTWVAGEQGGLFVSSNAGTSYQAVKTPYAGTYFGIVEAGANLVVYGMRGNAYWSADAGATWQKCEIPGTNSLTAALRARNGELLLTDDAGSVFISRDDGKRFVRNASPRLGPLNAITETTDGQLLLAGVRGIHRTSLSKLATDNKP